MSLRFLKAKPKLTFSKDKVRSTTKNEEPKIDLSKAQSPDLESKQSEDSTTTSKVQIESSQKNSISIEEKTLHNNCNEEQNNIATENTKEVSNIHGKNISNLHVSEEVNKVSDPIIDHGSKTTNGNVEGQSDNNCTDMKSSVTASNKTSVNNKFRFLKAKPKIGLNLQTKIRTSQPQSENYEVKHKIDVKIETKEPSHDTKEIKLANKEENKVSLQENKEKHVKEFDLENKNHVTKQDTTLNSERIICHNQEPIDTTSMEEIKQDSKLASQPVASTSVPNVSCNNLALEQKKLFKDLQKVAKPSSSVQKEPALNAQANVKLTPAIKNISPEKSQVKELKKDPLSKTKSLSSYIKQLEHEKLLSSQQNTVQSVPNQEPKQSSPDTTESSCKVDSNLKKQKDEHIRKKTIPKTNEQTELDPPISKLKKGKAIPVIKNKAKTSDSKDKHTENKKAIKKKEIDPVATKVHRISNLINDSKQMLKNEEKNGTFSIPKKSSQIMCRATDYKTNNKNRQGEAKDHNIKSIGNVNNKSNNLILTEENIKTIPIVYTNLDISTPKNANTRTFEEKNVFLLLEEHLYAKPDQNIYSSPEMSNKPERSIATEKIRNLRHDEKINWKHLNPSEVIGLNSFQKALLLEDINKIEDDQMSENSEWESRLVIDVNACTFNRPDDPEEAPINEISYSFNDTELKQFSGLSLVTKIIKEEVGNPFDDVGHDYFSRSDYGAKSSDGNCASNVDYQEEVIYNDNIVEIVEPYDYQDTVENNLNEGMESPNEIKDSPGKNKRPRQQKHVMFNLDEQNNQRSEIKKEKTNSINKIPKKRRKIKEEEVFDLSELKDGGKKVMEVVKTEASVVDNDALKHEIKVKQDEDDSYIKDNDEEWNDSDLEIDIDEREFIINGRKNHGGKKKASERIFLKRQSETMKKIKSQVSWKENLTVSDLIFYNPKTNPMSNPPDTAVTKSNNEVILDANNEKPVNDDLSEDEEAVDNPEPVPRLKISADGKLIIDPQSLIIEETGLKKSKERLKQSEALVESKYTIKKFDNLYSKRKIKRQTHEWTPEDTIMFYRAVNTIGTDFSMMATLFENRTRADIKRKFKREERKNPSLLSRAMRNYNNFDIEELKCELDADKRRIEKIKEEEKERKDMLKKEKSSGRRRSNKTSVCGKLIQDEPRCYSKKKVPEYVEPHYKMFKIMQAQIKPSNITQVAPVCS